MEQLAFDSATFVTFKDRTDRWVDVKHFQVRVRPEDDEQLLTTLISHEMYRDDYLGSDSWKDTESSVHGPYRLDALSATAFEGIDQATAFATIRTWAEKYRELSETCGPGPGERGPPADPDCHFLLPVEGTRRSGP